MSPVIQEGDKIFMQERRYTRLDRLLVWLGFKRKGKLYAVQYVVSGSFANTVATISSLRRS